MAIEISTIKDFLGISGADSDALIESLIASAYEGLLRATGTDWRTVDSATADEAVRLQVWLEFCAVRGVESNTQYMQARLTHLTMQLRYGGDADVLQQSDTTQA